MKEIKLLFLLLSILNVQGYLPGYPMATFKAGNDIKLKVNSLTSTKTQLPYSFYYLPFCKPTKIETTIDNLGEYLAGDEIQSSLYPIEALKPATPCKVVRGPNCTSNYKKDDLEKFRKAIQDEYKVQWILDNLSAAQPKLLDQATGKEYLELGFPVGWVGSASDLEHPGAKEGSIYINNHVDIVIEYHKDPSYEGIRIVGFLVSPRSVKHSKFADEDSEAYPASCETLTTAPYQSVDGDSQYILWTYSVTWRENKERTWAERWDPYLVTIDPQIHWFSIINSLMIVLFLSGMVAMILMRTLNADITRYNQLDKNEEAEETGWKLVHGDVFRAPVRPMFLSVFVGSGIQIFGMGIVVMVFAVLGFLSPSNRGGLANAVIFVFVVMGLFSGYFSSRVYKITGGEAWKKNTITTAGFLPGVIATVFFFVNLFVWGEHSSGALPFVTMLGLVMLWLVVSVPLVFCGSYFAFKKPVPEPPVATNRIPRHIPQQLWYMHPILSILMGGILPFGAVFIELFFILSAIWGDRIYYIFGFLFIVFVILILTSAEITIVMCYFQLCSEDYHWWWRSFLTSGAAAVYMFFYSIFYFFTKLSISAFIPSLMFFAYSGLMSFVFFCLTGSIGFYSCLFFVRKIYGSIKVD